MARITLTLDTVGELDNGDARRAINQCFATAMSDLEDRGDDEQPRKVLIEVTVKKNESGDVSVTIEAGVKIPKLRTRRTTARLKMTGGRPELVFQSLDKDSPDQATIDEIPGVVDEEK